MQRLFVCLFFLLVLCALTILFSPQLLEESNPSRSLLLESISVAETEDDTACRWPKFDHQNASILRLINPPDRIECEKGFAGRLVFVDENGYLAVNNETVAMLSYLAEYPIACSYSYIDSAPNDHNRIVYSGQNEFYTFSNGRMDSKPVKLTEGDFVRIQCYQRGRRANVIYANAYAHGTLKNKRRWPGFLRHSPSTDQNRFSVLAIFFDGVSLPAFRRHMPSTYSYLTESGTRAYTFRGFTKVAPDSNSNIMAMLTGKRASTTMFGHRNASVPFIWNEFDGYVTSFHEDSVRFGLFSQRKFDFVGKPTDFYYRPFYAELNRLRPNLPYCGGHRTISETQLEVVERQLMVLNDTMQFNVVYMGEMIRENVANLELVDASFSAFLRRMSSMRFWERTLLLLAGTRGPKKGRLRQSLAGVFEERMPLLILKPPRRFLDQNPGTRRRLTENERRLVTHFDVYATFRHILDVGKNFDRPVSNESRTTSFGTSLFEPIGKGRTCEEAGIPYQFCPCQRVQSLDARSEVVERASRNLLESVNKILESHVMFNGSESYRASALCRKFELSRVVRSERFYLDGSYQSAAQLSPRVRLGLAPEHRTRLRVLIKCQPGDAMFEAEMIPRSLHAWLVAGDITRLDQYRDYSYCVQEDRVKPFCICRTHRV